MHSWLDVVNQYAQHYQYTISILGVIATLFATLIALYTAYAAKNMLKIKIDATCSLKNIIHLETPIKYSEPASNLSIVATLVNTGIVDATIDKLAFEISPLWSSENRIFIPLSGFGSSSEIVIPRGSQKSFELFSLPFMEEFNRKIDLRFLRIFRMQHVRLHLRLPTGERIKIKTETLVRKKITDYLSAQ